MITVILPIYNEEKSLNELFKELETVLSDKDYEIIAVNDGSYDGSYNVLKSLAKNNNRVKLINFKKNYGQTAAINAGIQSSSGDIIVFIDSDLENLPSDIPMMIDKLNEGYDVVSGWRKNRWEGNFLTRKLPSLIANFLISKISGVKLNDYGCTLKIYRREVIKDVRLYGQMHRFIPVYCKWQGAKVTEIPVNYQPRKYGVSNYGLSRTFKVIMDLVVLKFLDKYMQRPMHFFGGVGFFSIFISTLSFLLALYFKINGEKDFVETPLPIFTAMFFIVGLLMILLGVLAEILMRTYYESQHLFPYTIKEKVNFD